MSEISWNQLVNLYKSSEDDEKNSYLLMIRDQAAKDSKFAFYVKSKGIHI